MVKWPQQSDKQKVRFEGRTSEEAVQLARLQLGNAAPVRCWKARRGGIFGFFAKEIYVAGIDAPQGSANVDEAVRAEANRSSIAAWTYDPTRFASPADGVWSEPDDGPSLAELVESTRDELTLATPNVLETAFIDVLAQAQAALDLDAPRRSEQRYLGAVLPDAPEIRPATFPVVVLPDRSPGPERIEGLRAFVAHYGLASDYWPDESEATLDGLVRTLSKLPTPASLPSEPGSVVVVVGTRRDVQVASARLLELMGLDASDLIEAECTTTFRQRVARRRLSHVSIVTVEAPLRSRGLGEIRTWIESLRPDYVIATVSAAAKRADVESWRRQLPHVDALALSRLGETTSPGELLGDVPVLLVEGVVASPLRWVALILGCLLEQR